MSPSSTKGLVLVRAVACLLAVLAVGGVVGACAAEAPVEFNAEQWNRRRTVGMAYRIEDSSLVASMTVDEVEALLGEPDDQDIQNGDGVLFYDLPRGLYLRVEFVHGRSNGAMVEDWN